MSQCVPGWDLGDIPFSVSGSHSISMADDRQDYQVEKGQLGMDGIEPPRVPVLTYFPPKYASEKPRATGTLESIVNQATHQMPTNIVPWFVHHSVATAATMDAIVPAINHPRQQHLSRCAEPLATADEEPVLSVKRARVACVVPEWSQNESAATFGSEKLSTKTTTAADDHDHSRPQSKIDEEKEKGDGKCSISTTKRNRVAAVHNQSERQRRDKINQRMKTLQELLPNSSKTDKVSLLDEVITYIKQLKAEASVTNSTSTANSTSMPSMALPMSLQQQQLLQMPMIPPMGMGMGMDDMNTMGQPNIPGTFSGFHPSAFMPLTSWDGSSNPFCAPPTVMNPFATFPGCHSQPMVMDVYSRMAAAWYEQLHQPPTSSSNM